MRATDATPAEWEKWRLQVAGDDDEDLSKVFKQVGRSKRSDTRAEWARDWRTRTFCDLALHLIYERHIRGVPSESEEESPIFAEAKASALRNHASRGFFSEADFQSLTVDRFNATWGQQPAFCKDLVEYLFRPTPYLRRIDQLHPRLIVKTEELTLAEWLRYISKAELDSASVHPLVALHTLVETGRPSDPVIKKHVTGLRKLRMQRWADLHERVFTAYGAALRGDPDLDWLGLAESFSSAAGGAFLRSQTRTAGAMAGVDGRVLGNTVVSIVPAFVSIDNEEMETRRLQRPVVLA
ncbi:hypothetical protein [Streptomyces sp. H39-C1]|uniref:hypothetical protein n=1 Tax=Streptomyces sp. H39-C1 TaxID=3004355 RepID=UPI0022AEF98B|nr:hypothetical protein [Streptomyces sp. H39-C1]MCZ4101942.1 hypothetical protein [Streptomyces sp. H39-C1]